MKKLLFLFILSLIIVKSEAQNLIHLSGQIKNSKSDEPIYLAFGNTLMPLKLSTDGTFAIDANIQQFPSFFYFAKISKKGKIEKQSPLIWFEKDSLNVNFDWNDKSLQNKNVLPYQSLSEKIENLKDHLQNEYILSNPINVPILYFVNKNKDNILISDLELFSQKVDSSYKNSSYYKELASYISAKKRNPIKIGELVENFTLPNKDGNQVSIVNKSEKTKLISIFSSGCAYSIASISMLEQIAKINNDKIDIITIWADDTKDIWLNQHLDQKNKITWTNVLDENKFASTYFNNTEWPTFYIVNSDGRLIDIFKNYTQKTANKIMSLVK